jgi:hypothetical protein
MCAQGAPPALRWAAAATLAEALLRTPADHGLPRPDPQLFGADGDADRLRAALYRGEITVRPPLTALAYGRAQFGPGPGTPVDVVVDATAPGVEVPFLDHWRLPWKDGAPRLLLNVAHPVRADLHAVGLLGSSGATWRIMEWQAELVARLVIGGPEALAVLRRRDAPDISPWRQLRALRRATRLLDRLSPPERQAAPTQAT